MAEHACTISDGDCTRILWYGNRLILVGNSFEENQTNNHRVNVWQLTEDLEDVTNVGSLEPNVPIRCSSWTIAGEDLVVYDANIHSLIGIKIE